MAPEFQAKKLPVSLIALAAAIVLFPALTQNPYYLNVANIIGLNTIVVVGLNLLIGYAGQISLGHAAFYGLGAYISGVLTVTYNISPWIALVTAVCVTAVLALLIGIPTLKLHGHYLVMATLGLNLIINIIMVQWDTVTGGPSGFPGIPYLSIGNWSFDSDLRMYGLIWGVVFVAIVLALNLVHSRPGRALRALHGSELAASCFGVDTKSYKVKVFVLSAIYASLAGSLYAHYLTFISPKTFDIFFSVELVTMVIVGGMGSIWGVLFGTIFLTSLPNVLHFFDEYKDIVYGLILVLILIFMPQGVGVAIRERWWRRGELERQAAPAPVPATRSEHAFAGNRASRPSATTHSGPILQIQNVSLNFGGLMALADVSCDIPEGAITALIGPNGAGKTTMINVISGIHRRHRGTIRFGVTDTRGLNPYQMAKMGMARTFQNVELFDHMSVLENVMVGMHARTRNEFVHSIFRLPGFTPEERRIEQKAWEALFFVGLASKGSFPAHSLSFGEQRRLEMARALVAAPRLVLLDEPVAGLNMTESLEIARLITDIRSHGISVLLVEHDMNVVMKISDKIIVLNFGNKIAEGLPDEIQRNEQVLTAYLGGVA
ncbi:MAG: ABC transporter permease subunit [Thermodesulfobacteriota bacterium]